MTHPAPKSLRCWVFFLLALALTGCAQVSLSLGALSAEQRLPASPTAAASPTASAVATTAVPPTALPSATPLPTLTSTPTPLPTQTPTPVPVNPAIAGYLANLASLGEFSGSVLIAQGEALLLSQGYGDADHARSIPNTPQTRFRIGSLTKSFTAAAVLQLQAQGKLDVQDPICAYLDPCPAAWQAITVHELLTHTSGIPDYANAPSFDQIADQDCAPEQIVALFKDLPLQFAPGSRWSYSNSGYVLLGVIVEKVSGESYEDYVKGHLLQPLGLEDTGMDHGSGPESVGYADGQTEAGRMNMSSLYSAGGFYSTVGDLARWVRALAGGDVVPQPLAAQLMTSFADTGDDSGRSYGYGWFLGGDGAHPWAAHGGRVAGFSANLVDYRKDGLVVVVLSNQANVDAEGISFMLGKLQLGE